MHFSIKDKRNEYGEEVQVWMCEDRTCHICGEKGVMLCSSAVFGDAITIYTCQHCLNALFMAMQTSFTEGYIAICGRSCCYYRPEGKQFAMEALAYDVEMTLDDKAANARRLAREERQARADASLPPRPSPPEDIDCLARCSCYLLLRKL